MWDWRTRAHFEANLALTVAGPISAAIYAADNTSGYRPAPVTAEERARLEQELAVVFDLGAGRGRKHPPPPLRRRPDDEIALELVRLGASDIAVERTFSEWVTSAVVAWIKSEAFARKLSAVTSEVLRHGTISGAHLARTIARAQREIETEVGEQ
jgi:hypothetical protein